MKQKRSIWTWKKYALSLHWTESAFWLDSRLVANNGYILDFIGETWSFETKQLPELQVARWSIQSSQRASWCFNYKIHYSQTKNKQTKQFSNPCSHTKQLASLINKL